MKITDKMQNALNKQINAEFYSAYIYVSMSAYFETKKLKGFALWMKHQAKEEIEHAMKIFDYVNDRDGTVKLAQIPTPPLGWKSPEAACYTAYKHEQSVTKMIHDLTTLAESENDKSTVTFLDWFVDEQVEEEATSLEIFQRVKYVENSGTGLLIVDKELADRK